MSEKDEIDAIVLEYRRTRDPRLGQRIWTAMQVYVDWQASKLVKYDPKRLTIEDLSQEAWFGILRAVATFDPTRRVHFTSFATSHVRGKMWDAVRYPRRKNYPNTPVYLSPLASEGANGRMTPSILEEKPDDRGEEPCEEASRTLLMEDLMTCVSSREQLLFQLLYCEEMTMKQIGKVMDLSESRISQMHKDALARLRERWQLQEEDLCGVRG